MSEVAMYACMLATDYYHRHSYTHNYLYTMTYGIDTIKLWSFIITFECLVNQCRVIVLYTHPPLCSFIGTSEAAIVVCLEWPVCSIHVPHYCMHRQNTCIFLYQKMRSTDTFFFQNQQWVLSALHDAGNLWIWKHWVPCQPKETGYKTNLNG